MIGLIGDFIVKPHHYYVLLHTVGQLKKANIPNIPAYLPQVGLSDWPQSPSQLLCLREPRTQFPDSYISIFTTMPN